MKDETEEMPRAAIVIRERREARGWSQSRLAEAVGTNQQTIEKIEKGIIKNSSFFPALSAELNVDIANLVPSLIEKSKKAESVIQASELVGGSEDFPVFAGRSIGDGVMAKSRGPVQFVVRPEPLKRVKDAFGVIVGDDSMSPEFRLGHIALIHPYLPPKTGVTCIFIAKDRDGEEHYVIRHLRRITPEAWLVQQWSPSKGESNELTLDRSQWQTCLLTVGRYG